MLKMNKKLLKLVMYNYLTYLISCIIIAPPVILFHSALAAIEVLKEFWEYNWFSPSKFKLEKQHMINQGQL